MSRAPLLSRASVTSRATLADAQNLLFPSEPASLAEIYSKSSISIVDYNWVSVGGCTKAVYFSDNSVVRWAYQYFVCNPAKTYTLSVTVVMEDGSAPIVNSQLGSSDFMLVFSSGAVAGTVTSIPGTQEYIVSYTGKGTAAGILFGAVKYVSNSAKKFKITALHLEEGIYVNRYIKTTVAEYNIGAIRQPAIQIQNFVPWSNRPDKPDWVKGTGVPTPTPNTLDVLDPFGGNAANKLTYDGSAYVGAYKLAIRTGDPGRHIKPQLLTVWLRMLTGTRLMALGNNNGSYPQFTVTNQWQKFKVPFSPTIDGNISTFSLFDYNPDNSPFAFYLYNAGSINGWVESDEVITGASVLNSGDIRPVIS